MKRQLPDLFPCQIYEVNHPTRSSYAIARSIVRATSLTLTDVDDLLHSQILVISNVTMQWLNGSDDERKATREILADKIESAITYDDEAKHWVRLPEL